MSEENKSIDKKLYEISFDIVPTSKEKASAELESIKKVLSKHKAEIVKEGQLELINLAYIMTKKLDEKNQRFSQAYFGFIAFEATIKSTEDIKSEIESNPAIIRSLIVKTTNDPEHSTNKIAKDKQDEITLDDADDFDDSEEPVESEKTSDSEKDQKITADQADAPKTKKTPTKKTAKTADSKDLNSVDSAIDELIK
ncbi:MAG TPA: 30S ribosomal protein S6 [Candidatus Paceibacterota bacterium]|nr:30S ribosomal protein S6 [Candidatus Paceibacterota bacterium]